MIVTPLTTKIEKKKDMPTHCQLGYTRGLDEQSVAILEQIKTIDKSRVICYLGKLTDKQMENVECAIQISLGIEVPKWAGSCE